MRLIGVLLIVVALAAVRPVDASASARETPRVTGGANAGWFIIGGDDFENTDSGPGVDAHMSMALVRSLALNLGVHYSKHGMAKERWEAISHSDSYYGVYLEPRLSSPRSKFGLTPFVGFRVGWVERTGGDYGHSIGGIAGAVRHLSGPAWIELAATLSSLSLESDRHSANDEGKLASIQLGVRVPFSRTRP